MKALPSRQCLQRERAKLRTAQSDLAERQVDRVAYERVFADMTRRYQAGEISPYSGGETVALVRVFRDGLRRQCEDLGKNVAILEKDVAILEKAATPKEKHA